MSTELMNEYRENYKTVITLDAETLESYDKYHARQHPHRKNQSLSWLGKTRTGVLPMLNNFINVRTSIQRSQRKADVGDYVKYALQYQGVKRAMIERCMVVVKHYNPTKREFDLDGVSVKSAFDAMTAYEFWADDNYKIVRPLIFTGGYDKAHPRSEICVYEITDEYPYEFVLQVVMDELEQEEINKTC